MDLILNKVEKISNFQKGLKQKILHSNSVWKLLKMMLKMAKKRVQKKQQKRQQAPKKLQKRVRQVRNR